MTSHGLLVRTRILPAPLPSFQRGKLRAVRMLSPCLIARHNPTLCFDINLCCQVAVQAGSEVIDPIIEEPFRLALSQEGISELDRFAKIYGEVIQRILLYRNKVYSFKGWASHSIGGLPMRCGSYMTALFRTADGSCNNKFHWGETFQPIARLIAPAYNDGLTAPRTHSVLGKNISLPSARLVSRTVHSDKRLITTLTIMFMNWGQFVDHDIVSTPGFAGTLKCCDPNEESLDKSKNSECFPIMFPSGDPVFPGTCMEFLRSAFHTDGNGYITLPREQLNAITSFMDASNVYGSSQEEQDKLKDPVNGHLLRITPDGFLPDNGKDDCNKRTSADVCFLAGDGRANEQPGLTMLHIIFVRYHNFLASELLKYLPDLTHDYVFQQARAIVAAVLQNIMYSEWLPIMLGPSIRAKYQLDLDRYYRSNYDPDQDPRIFNAFSTAAYRIGHSLIPRSLPLSPSRRVLLRNLFFKPFETKENLETLLEGTLSASDAEDCSQPADNYIVEEVSDHLFEKQGEPGTGFDLPALNIQRGRDHGLPAYNDYRAAMGLQKVKSFRDSALGEAGPLLEKVYHHADDIDLFSGGLAEPAFDGGLAGETFSNLLGLQFHRLKSGDRFFFHHQRKYFGFTNAQVALLQDIKLVHVLCQTTALSKVQPEVFRVPGQRNQPQKCSWFRAQHPNMTNFVRYPI